MNAGVSRKREVLKPRSPSSLLVSLVINETSESWYLRELSGLMVQHSNYPANAVFNAWLEASVVRFSVSKLTYTNPKRFS